MAIIFILFLISFILFVLNLIKPISLFKTIKNPSRKKGGFIFGLMTIVFFILIGVFPESELPPTDNANIVDSINIQNEEINAENNANTEINNINEIVNSAEKKEAEVKSNNVEEELYLVTNVVDGDTIDVIINGQEERLRLIGVDTPETKDPRKPVQCFGVEASSKATELLLNKKVRLEFDSSQSKRDKYNRLLAYIYREDGLFYNKWIIENGYAHEYTYVIPYNYQEEFKTAENYARENQLGLWNPDTCNGSAELNEEVKEDTNYSQDDEVKQTNEKIIETLEETKEVDSAQNIYTCNTDKNCGDMSSCEEAYFYLNTCNKKSLDRDSDGVPCESICN